MNKNLLIPIFLVLMLAPIFAVGPCWEQITCSSSGILSTSSIIVPDYTFQTNYEEYCEVQGLNTDYSETGWIEIELSSGGYKDSDRDRIWILDRSASEHVKINFYFNKSVSPIYLDCYAVFPADQSNGFPTIRIVTLNTWTASYDGGNFDFINPVEKANEWYVVNGNDTYFALQLRDTNAFNLYQNLPAKSYNPFIQGLAWLLFTFGIFLSFTFVFQLFKRR